MTALSTRSTFRLSLAAAAGLVLLTACGGGGDGAPKTDQSGVTPTPVPTATSTPAVTAPVAGIVVRPNAQATQISHSLSTPLMAAPGSAAGSKKCPNVPLGYSPEPNVTVKFTDANTAPTGELKTDNCGNFNGKVKTSTTRASAKTAAGDSLVINKPLQTLKPTQKIAARTFSLVPKGAGLVMEIQKQKNNNLALTVRDTQTQKAVLGLSTISFTVTDKNGKGLPIDSLNYASLQTDNQSSVVLAMDSSGSMKWNGSGTKGSANFLNGWRTAWRASATLLQGLQSGKDEAAMVIFDSTIHKINDAWLKNKTTWVDADDKTKPAYTFSSTGFTKDLPKMGVINDLYNPSSRIYLTNKDDTSSTTDPVSAETAKAKLYLRKDAIWHGNTALYDAIDDSVQLLTAHAANPRKVVVALTDGANNSSSVSENTAIQNAKKHNTTVYTVGFGDDVKEDVLKNIADKTGGAYKKVADAKTLTQLFDGIRTGITHQYTAKLKNAPKAGDTLVVTVDHAGKKITRNLVWSN